MVARGSERMVPTGVDYEGVIFGPGQISISGVKNELSEILDIASPDEDDQTTIDIDLE